MQLFYSYLSVECIAFAVDGRTNATRLYEATLILTEFIFRLFILHQHLEIYITTVTNYLQSMNSILKFLNDIFKFMKIIPATRKKTYKSNILYYAVLSL